MFRDILLWGLVVGVIHFIVVGFLYMNPLVAREYKKAEGHPALKVWKNQKNYLLSMFLGTQIEIYLLTGAYLFFRSLFPEPLSVKTAILLAAILAAIRVYPRFWNMWIQSTYPINLLVVEFINGTIGTFVVIFSLWLLPIS